MINPRKKIRRKRGGKRGNAAQALLAFLVVVGSLLTDGFGALPPSLFSEDFRKMLSENLPIEFIVPFNEYLNNLESPTIPLPQFISEAPTVEEDTDLDKTIKEIAESLIPLLVPPVTLPEGNQPTSGNSNPTAPEPQTLPVNNPPAPPLPPAPPRPPTPNRPPSCQSVNYNYPQTSGVVTVDLSKKCSDPDGDPWSIISVSKGNNGVVSFSSASISYDPNNGFAGTENISYTIKDSKGSIYNQTFNISITNLPPIAKADTATIAKNSTTAIVISVLANDSDPGGDAITITGASSVSGATVSVVGANVEYIPPTGFLGTDSFTYTIQDTHGGTATGTVNVTTNNAPPTCANFSYTNPQTTGVVSIDLSSWCSDPNNDTWAITAVTQGVNGATTFAGKIINYNPNDGFAGTDNLTFTLNDGTGGVYTNSFDVIINNAAPIATNDAGTVDEDSGANTINVLTNDSDPGNDLLTITAATQGINGAVAIAPGATTLTYTPEVGFRGTDSFTYTITDAHGGTSTATVDITVYAAPLACLDSGSINTSDNGCETIGATVNGFSTPVYVQPGDALYIQVSYRVWDVPYPTIPYQILFGLNNIYSGAHGAYASGLGTYNPGSWGGYAFGMTAPTTPGSYAIYGNLVGGTSCDATDYLGSGTSFGQVTVCENPIIAYTDGSACYAGPGTNYNLEHSSTSGGYLKSYNDSGSTPWYKLEWYWETTPGVINTETCWVPETAITNLTPDFLHCVPYEYVAPPPAANYLTIYNVGATTGNIGGRASADAICAANIPSGQTYAKAFLSDDTLAISNFPATYGIPTNLAVYNLSGTYAIANDWADLLDGTISRSLQDAFISSSWWSGSSTAAGASSINNCNNWTNALDTVGGMIGSGTATNSTWITLGSAGCHQPLDLLCIAYP